MRIRIHSICIIFLLLLSFIQFCGCSVGHKLNKRDTSANDSLEKYPYWIAMMDSPNVNYNKAVDAFDKFWQHREKPTEDDGEGQDIYGSRKTEDKNSDSGRNIEYVYEYKRFLNWEQRNKNLLKPDGTVMTPEEVIEQWKKTQNDTLKR